MHFDIFGPFWDLLHGIGVRQIFVCEREGNASAFPAIGIGIDVFLPFFPDGQKPKEQLAAALGMQRDCEWLILMLFLNGYPLPDKAGFKAHRPFAVVALLAELPRFGTTVILPGRDLLPLFGYLVDFEAVVFEG